MKTIPLTRGKQTLVSDEDFEELAQHKWAFATEGYAYRLVRVEGKLVAIYMHRQIVGLEPGDKREVDHDDGDGLNNVRTNLRVCTHGQNQHNRRVSSNSKSGVKGVFFCPRYGRWRAQITYDGKQKALGSFDTLELAGEFRALAADMVHGVFAHYGQ